MNRNRLLPFGPKIKARVSTSAAKFETSSSENKSRLAALGFATDLVADSSDSIDWFTCDVRAACSSSTGEGNNQLNVRLLHLVAGAAGSGPRQTHTHTRAHTRTTGRLID